ncbi:MAG: C-GCAxxG-C-C family (seleno)protein [Lachnospiraceae bacterium]|nr:C-GCAxxG-C-C family (seleno)protein [Lachnospiraceae bacterium]
MLKEKAKFYYGTEGKNCAEGILLAANDAYALNLTDTDIQLFSGFGGGMGCGSTCGSLTGAIAVLGKLFGDRENFRDLCGEFVSQFEATLGAQDCETLAAKYKTEETRCVTAVEMTADILEKYIDKLNGKQPEVPADGCTLTADEIKNVKGMGFLHQKGTNKFNARVITRNGRITAKESMAIAEAAKLYGDGHMMLTTRLTVEVSGVDFNNISAFQEYISRAGLVTGGTGSKVRPIVCCKGTTCQYGLYDTYELSEEAHRKFYIGYRNVSLPHKFKIAFGGCPNNCVKPNLNDIGIIGAKVPQYDESVCRGCKKCQIEAACPIHAAKLSDGKLTIDWDKCNNCGRCIGKCPFHCSDEGTYGYKIYIGGRWGKNVAQGQMLNKLFTSKQEVLDTIEKTILFFRSEGISGERLADTVNRVGFEKAEAMILSDELLKRKNEILGLNVVGGASC